MEILVILGVLWPRKTKPNKANLKRNQGFLHMAQEIATALRASQWHQDLCGYEEFEKTKPIAGLRPEIRNTKFEILSNGIKQSPIWKNKPNLWQGKNGAKSYMKGIYEEFHALRWRKNKPNSKPNNVTAIWALRWLRSRIAGRGGRCRIWRLSRANRDRLL